MTVDGLGNKTCYGYGLPVFPWTAGNTSSWAPGLFDPFRFLAYANNTRGFTRGISREGFVSHEGKYSAVTHVCLSSGCCRKNQLFFFFLDLPATFNAIATACFCGFPASISVLIFWLIVSFDDPFFNGIFFPPEIPSYLLNSSNTQIKLRQQLTATTPETNQFFTTCSNLFSRAIIPRFIFNTLWFYVIEQMDISCFARWSQIF